MGFMVKDQHLDEDLFRLFLEKGLHKAYGDLCLLPSQIDDVDVTPYLGS